MKKPNILIIISDQQSIDTIAAYKKIFKDKEYSCHHVKTPNFDRLVKNSYSFKESHSHNPVCCPGRAAIFTGRPSTETGLTYNNIGIDKDIPNMAQWFGENSDYDCYYCGKWHAGGKWNYPAVKGPRKIPGFTTIAVGASGMGDINDFQVSGAMRGFLENYKKDTPFLAVAGLLNPHDICFWTPGLRGKAVVAKNDYYQLGDELPPLPPNNAFGFEEPGNIYGSAVKRSKTEWQNYIYDYHRMIEKLDADVGRIIDAIDARKDDNIVIFTADHGEGLGRHQRVQKWHPFEESVKVPLIFYAPGKISKNIINEDVLVSGMDIMPTVCDFAGIAPPPEYKGKTLRPLLEGGDLKIKNTDHVYSEFKYTGRVIRTKKYKYIKYYKYSGEKDSPFVRKSDGMAEKFIPCEGRKRYQEEQGKALLFDMENDPWETKNIISEPGNDKIAEFHEQLLIENWEKKMIAGTHFDRN